MSTINEIDFNLKNNKIDESKRLLDSVNEKDNAEFKIIKAKLLYLTGKYQEVLDQFGNETNAGIKSWVFKANNAINLLKSNNVSDTRKMISTYNFLFKESYLSKEIAINLINLQVKNKEFRQAKDIAQSLHEIYSSDTEIKKIYGHCLCLTSFYMKGIEILKDLNFNEAFKFEEILKKYKDDMSDEQKKVLITEIRLVEKSSAFNPSIFGFFKYNILYISYLRSMIGFGKAATQEAKELSIEVPNYETFYILGRSLLIERKIAELDEVLKDKNFPDGNYKNILRQQREIELKKIAEEEEAKRKKDEKRREKEEMEERQREREEAERRRKTHKHDISGYYEILGVKNTATKDEIKRAFKKKSLEVNLDKYKNDPNEYNKRSKLQMKINKAKDVLTNDKTRRLYDQGVDNEQPHSRDFQNYKYSKGQQTADFEDIFSAFFGGNSFGNSRGSRRTYYYYYG